MNKERYEAIRTIVVLVIAFAVMAFWLFGPCEILARFPFASAPMRCIGIRP